MSRRTPTRRGDRTPRPPSLAHQRQSAFRLTRLGSTFHEGEPGIYKTLEELGADNIKCQEAKNALHAYVSAYQNNNKYTFDIFQNADTETGLARTPISINDFLALSLPAWGMCRSVNRNLMGHDIMCTFSFTKITIHLTIRDTNQDEKVGIINIIQNMRLGVTMLGGKKKTNLTRRTRRTSKMSRKRKLY